MYTYDSQKAARVWERVQSGGEPKQPDRAGELRTLIANEWSIASLCLVLARQMPSREAGVLQGLSRECQGQMGCLKGIHILMTGENPKVSAPKPEAGTPEQMLRRCYGMFMRSLKEYEARVQDPEYGVVFANLAMQEQTHCRTVLELLGNLKKG